MSLLLTLNNALSGLNVSKQAMAVLSSNIANANTPGYSRKVQEQATRIVNGAGAGVQIDEIVRKVDEYLARAMQRQTGTFSKADAINEFTERVQLLLGKPGNADSVDSAITGFFNVMQTLADTPERGSLRLNAINAGVTLARKFSDLASELEQLRYQADFEIESATREVNTLLVQLEGINAAIATAANSGQGTAELLDKRDGLLQDLSEHLDISYYIGANGEVSVTSNTGVALLDGARYELDYSAQPSKDAFINDASMSPIRVYRITGGEQVGDPVELVTGGASDDVATGMVSGTIRGLLDMRDERIPRMLEQLDMLAATLRDQVNAVHNAGMPYPGAANFTGTRSVNATEYWEWQGRVRFALLGSDGRPVPSVYSGETSGFRPLKIDLGSLDTGGGAGKPTVQGIIDEINQHFHMPQNKASLGDINNIRLASDTTNLLSTSPSFTFDFDLENIAANAADFLVSSIQVLDSGGVDITSTTDTLPSIALAAANTYVTTNGSTTVTVNTAAAHGLGNGDLIYLPNPGMAINGIPASQINTYFTVSNVTSTSFTITTASAATATGGVAVAAQTARPKYAQALAGEVTRTRSNGTITASFTGNPTSSYYVIRANVAVRKSDGTYATGQVQYRVLNEARNIYNKRYSAEAVTGQAQLTAPSSSAPLLKAILVDANGTELATSNNIYVNTENGYLKIVAQNSGQYVAIDSLTSKQLGFPSSVPAVAGTNRSFAHFFELNNFFESNAPTSTGDTLRNSAYNLAVESRLRTNSNLISVGGLTQTLRPADPDLPPYYTYERNSGNNTAIQELAGLSLARVSFAAAGGLGETVTDFSGYAGEILGFLAAEARTAKVERDNAKVVLDGFVERANAASGVNLDEELANTIIYQNAYTASARLVTVTNELFETLINSV